MTLGVWNERYWRERTVIGGGSHRGISDPAVTIVAAGESSRSCSARSRHQVQWYGDPAGRVACNGLMFRVVRQSAPERRDWKAPAVSRRWHRVLQWNCLRNSRSDLQIVPRSPFRSDPGALVRVAARLYYESSQDQSLRRTFQYTS